MNYYSPPRRNGSARRLARGLGWFSLALGLAELIAPRTLARTLGMEQHAGILRAYGLREIATGAGLIGAEDPHLWMWGRVAGDALDLATLAPGLTQDHPRRAAVGVAAATVAAVTALDIYCARKLQSEADQPVAHFDYSGRSGFPDSPDRMRGAARSAAASGSPFGSGPAA